MCVTLPNRSMQAVISRAVPDVTVQHVQPVPSLRSQRLYDIDISNGTSLAIALPALPMVRLLRSEQGSISSEAAVLRWLAGLHVKKPLVQERTPEPEETRNLSLKGNHERRSSSPSEDSTARLTTFLPQLLLHATASNELRIEYNVTRPTAGRPIADHSPPLSTSERRAVDIQTGHLCQRLSKLESPTGRFGPAFAVLPSLTPPQSGASTPSARRDANARMLDSKGVESWSTAFHSMLEAVLRDGEDMAVMLGYANIRRQYRRLGHFLDGVTSSRLVAVDAGDDLNTLVLRTPEQPSAVVSDGKEDSDDEDNAGESKSTSSEEDQEDREAALQCLDPITVTGMKDWSNFVFGDPLFATIFTKDPSDDFLEGFNDTPAEHHEGSKSATQARFRSSLIDDAENAHIRLLLYDCYHTVTHVVREFYRPRKESSRHELAARKRLNDILTKLDAIEDSKPSLRRKPSGEMSPAKRAKSEGPDEE